MDASLQKHVKKNRQTSSESQKIHLYLNNNTNAIRQHATLTTDQLTLLVEYTLFRPDMTFRVGLGVQHEVY